MVGSNVGVFAVPQLPVCVNVLWIQWLPAAGRLAGYRDLRHLHLPATGAAAFVRVANDLQAEQDRQPVEWTTLCRLRAQRIRRSWALS